ncbi:MAG: hypothetical protein WDN23_11080 [Edaphobacter sp.]
MGILIQNGTVVTADRIEKADVLLEGATIREVRAGIDSKGHSIVDASGLFVLPGGVDCTHTYGYAIRRARFSAGRFSDGNAGSRHWWDHDDC